MSAWLIFLLCFLAIAIGWLLGRFPLSEFWRRFRNRGWHESYMQGIHLLLNEQSDQAIETFLQQWQVSQENFELHNALANMLRKKGEVDRAVRIHAGLVECNKLSQTQVRQATIELANDYIAAGLLDRAERLLINVVNNGRFYDERALELLQRVYQTENEWGKAITVAEQLLPRRTLSFTNSSLVSGRQTTEIAQYYCEMAEEALAEDNFSEVEKNLQQALRIEPDCGRARLMQARMATERGRFEQARQAIMQLADEDPGLLAETLNLLADCFTDDYQGLFDYLLKLLDKYPSAALEIAAYQTLVKVNIEQAGRFLWQRVRRRPTLAGINTLVQHKLSENEPLGLDYLPLLQQIVADVLKQKAIYRCRECGFSGVQMHWLCPQCKSWDSIRRIRGSEGD